MRSNAELVMEALARGLDVELDGRVFTLGVDEHDRPCLAYRLFRVAADTLADGRVNIEPTEQISASLMSVTSFLQLAGALTEEQRLGLVAMLTLQRTPERVLSAS
jgi:hypothetical protein